MRWKEEKRNEWDGKKKKGMNEMERRKKEWDGKKKKEWDRKTE